MKATKHTTTEVINHLCGLSHKAIKNGLSSEIHRPKGIWLLHESGDPRNPFAVHLGFSGRKSDDEVYLFETMEEVKGFLPEGFRLIKVTLEEVELLTAA